MHHIFLSESEQPNTQSMMAYINLLDKTDFKKKYDTSLADFAFAVKGKIKLIKPWLIKYAMHLLEH